MSFSLFINTYAGLGRLYGWDRRLVMCEEEDQHDEKEDESRMDLNTLQLKFAFSAI